MPPDLTRKKEPKSYTSGLYQQQVVHQYVVQIGSESQWETRGKVGFQRLDKRISAISTRNLPVLTVTRYSTMVLLIHILSLIITFDFIWWPSAEDLCIIITVIIMIIETTIYDCYSYYFRPTSSFSSLIILKLLLICSPLLPLFYLSEVIFCVSRLLLSLLACFVTIWFTTSKDHNINSIYLALFLLYLSLRNFYTSNLSFHVIDFNWF